MLPFLPLKDADELLADHYEQEAQAGEIEAELGSSYFYGGMSSWDATTMARRDMNDARDAFESSPEGQKQAERLEAAQFMRSLTGLEVVTVEDLNDPWTFTPMGAPVVYEFYPDGPMRHMFDI
jgi:hypothetical protein